MKTQRSPKQQEIAERLAREFDIDGERVLFRGTPLK